MNNKRMQAQRSKASNLAKMHENTVKSAATNAVAE